MPSTNPAKAMPPPLRCSGRCTSSTVAPASTSRSAKARTAAEVRLRARAAELTAMLRGGKPRAGSSMAATCAQLGQEIGAGVDQYGRLVSAASEAASASTDLAERVAPVGGLSDATEQLGALATGMREITEAATTRP